MSTNSGVLSGRRVLITRPAHQSAALAQLLRDAGAVPVLAPTIRLVPPDDPAAAQQAVDRAGSYAWIVFTSANGVQAFFDILRARGDDAKALRNARIAAIGIKTSHALLESGHAADLVPQAYVAEDLAQALIAASKPSDRVLVFRAQEARDVLPQRLRAAGRIPDVIAAYKTEYAEDPELPDEVAQCDVLTFTSASTVRGFVHNLHGPARAARAALGKLVACIGPITADEARKSGMHVDVTATEFTTEGLVAALLQAAAQ